jgi:hypothetical protein
VGKELGGKRSILIPEAYVHLSGHPLHSQVLLSIRPGGPSGCIPTNAPLFPAPTFPVPRFREPPLGLMCVA